MNATADAAEKAAERAHATWRAAFRVFVAAAQRADAAAADEARRLYNGGVSTAATRAAAERVARTANNAANAANRARDAYDAAAERVARIAAADRGARTR